MAKVDKKQLIKMAKKLNKLDLTEDAVEVKGDVDDIKEDFISGIEEIDDDGSIDEVPSSIIKFYESILNDGGGDGDGDETPDLEDMDEDELDDFKKERKLKIKGYKDMDEDDKREAIEEALKESSDNGDEAPDLDEMDEDELDELKKERKLKIKGYKDMDEDEKREALGEAIEDDGKGKGKGKKSKKDKKAKKGKGKKSKKDKKAKKEKLPKGLRTGTLPAALYAKIKEGDVTWGDLAGVVAEEKDKDAEKCMGLALRTVTRKVAKAVPITATFSGEDDEAVFALADGDDD